MEKGSVRDVILWGFLLWLIGYGLGILLFAVVPAWTIGWYLLPVGVIVTTCVLWSRGPGRSFGYFLALALSWTAFAIVLDYFLIVKLFQPTDGYYKLDVYLYYVLTFVQPLIVGLIRRDARGGVGDR